WSTAATESKPAASASFTMRMAPARSEKVLLPKWRVNFMGSRPRRLLLGHVPEHRHRRHHHTVDFGAECKRLIILSEIDVGRMLGPVFLQLDDDLLLLRRIGLLGEPVAQLLDRLVARPAEHRLVA